MSIADYTHVMENQHRQITGYRDLSEEEIAAMNAIKAFGNSLGEIVANLEKNAAIDKRWLAIGKTDLQKGLMAVTRAIAKPESF